MFVLIALEKKVSWIYWQISLGKSGTPNHSHLKNLKKQKTRMSEFNPKVIEGNWDKTPITNESRYVQYLGLDAVTIRNSDNKPFFFLFIDVDSKNPEKLRDALNICREKRLSVYFYETCKGWHIISPCLLKIRNWTYCLMKLRKIQDSSGDTIRWTMRKCDGKMLHYQSWNRVKRPYEESYDLIFALHEKFNCDITSDKITNCVSTKLEWNSYNQMRLNLSVHR